MLVDIKDIIYDKKLKNKKQMAELKESISKYGLHHPIIIYQQDDKLYLKDGYKRLLVYEDLGLSEIDAVVIDIKKYNSITRLTVHKDLENLAKLFRKKMDKFPKNINPKLKEIYEQCIKNIGRIL